MADYYWLTPDDREFLDDMKRRMRNQVAAPRHDEPTPQIYQTPEIYVARTPPEGISGLTRVVGDPPADYPGVALCDIYQLIKDYDGQRAYLAPHPGNELFQRPIYNLNLSRVGGNRWALVRRDKDGSWWIESPVPLPDEDETVFPSGTGTTVPDTPTSGCDDIFIEEVDLWCESLSLLTSVSDETTTGTATTSTLVTGTAPGTFTIRADMGTGTGCNVTAELVTCGPWTCSLTETAPCEWTLVVDGPLIPGTWTVRLNNVQANSITSQPVAGTGTSITDQSNLNLYRRRVWLSLDPFTGCLVKSVDNWEYVRTVGCCDPTCVEPDVGTGSVGGEAPCCRDLVPAETLAFTMSGNLLPGCGLSNTAGTLTRYSADIFLWTNGNGTTSGDGQVTTVLRLHCYLNSWRMAGTIYRTGVAVNIDFNEALTLSGNGQSLLGTVAIGGGCGNASFVIDHPCPDAGTIDTLCCPDNLLPSTLTLTITGADACLNGSYSMIWDSGIEKWYIVLSQCGSGGLDWWLECDAGTWRLYTVTNNTCFDAFNSAPDLEVCDPFALTFNNVLLASGGVCGAGPATFTITE